MGQVRADEGVVPRSRQSGSGRQVWYQGAGRVGGRRGSEPGRRRRRRESGADEDCSGRGYWDTDRGRMDVDVGLRQTDGIARELKD